MIWSGRWERGSGLGTRVHPWLIHVNVWQNQYSILKQTKVKIKIKKKENYLKSDISNNGKPESSIKSKKDTEVSIMKFQNTKDEEKIHQVPQREKLDHYQWVGNHMRLEFATVFA